MIRNSGLVVLVGSTLALLGSGCQTSSKYLAHSPQYFAPDPALSLEGATPVAVPLETKPPPVPPIPPSAKKSFGKRIAELFRGSKNEEPAAEVIPPTDTKPRALPPDVVKPVIDAPAGADIREIEGGTVAFKYEGGRLKAEVSLRVKGQAEPLVLRAESDFSRGKVSNVVGHVQYPKPPNTVETAGFSTKPNRTEAPNKIPMARDLEVLPMPKPAKQNIIRGGYFPSDRR